MTPLNEMVAKEAAKVTPLTIGPAPFWETGFAGREAFVALFEKNPTPMFLAEPGTWKIFHINAAAENLFRLSATQVAGTSFCSLCVEDISAYLPLSVPHEAILCRHRRADGKLLHMQVSAQCLSIEGRLVKLLAISDVSAQKVAEDAYSEVQRKYQSIIENAVEGFYIKRPGGRFVEVNAAFAKMLGYESPAQLVDEIRDVSKQLYVNPAQRTVLMELLKRKGYVRSVEFQAKRRDGKIIWMSVSAREVKDAAGAVQYYEGLAEDVTDRKEADAKLREVNRSLASSMSQLQRSNADLEQFAYAVSHDLKEPLRLVSSYLTLLNLRHKSQMEDEGREFLEVAVEGSKRMKGLIEDLLAYSTIGATEYAVEDVDLRDIAEEVLKRLQPTILAAKANVTVGQLPIVRGTRVQMATLLVSLIENAIKFRRPDVPCQVGIQSTSRDEHWLIEVRDNGIGIDGRLMNKVFQIFQRGHSKERFEGNGIGLAIAKKIVELHGGRIWLNSMVGEGTTFCFTLPITKNPTV